MHCNWDIYNSCAKNFENFCLHYEWSHLYLRKTIKETPTKNYQTFYRGKKGKQMSLVSRVRVAEWFTVLCLLCATQMVVGSSPKPPPMLVDTSASTWIGKVQLAMLTPIQAAGVTPQVNLRIIQAGKHARDPPWALKPKADITRSPKQGFQWPHEKDLCPPKIFGKKMRVLYQSCYWKWDYHGQAGDRPKTCSRPLYFPSKTKVWERVQVYGTKHKHVKMRGSYYKNHMK